MVVVSADPGLTGAISLLCSRRGLLECADLPTCSNGIVTGSMLRWLDLTALQALLADWSTKYELAQEAVHVAIERPIPMPTLPAQTVACQFEVFGTIRAACHSKWGQEAMNIVAPKDWKRLFGLKADKDEARACALRLYPNAKQWIYRKKDHGRADSVLIGHFLMRSMA